MRATVYIEGLMAANHRARRESVGGSWEGEGCAGEGLEGAQRRVAWEVRLIAMKEM